MHYMQLNIIYNSIDLMFSLMMEMKLNRMINLIDSFIACVNSRLVEWCFHIIFIAFIVGRLDIFMITDIY